MTKTAEIKVRVTPAEHTALAMRAVRRGTSLSGLVRQEMGLEPASRTTYAARVVARWPESVKTAPRAMDVVMADVVKADVMRRNADAL